MPAVHATMLIFIRAFFISNTLLCHILCSETHPILKLKIKNCQTLITSRKSKQENKDIFLATLST